MRTLTKRVKPRWRRRKDARPEEIVSAALEVFADRGFAATKLEDIARRAGVTKGTIYLYFDSKEALFKALIRQTIVPVIAQGEAVAQSFSGSARELFDRLVREYWRLVLFFQAEDGIRDLYVTGVQTCALP